MVWPFVLTMASKIGIFASQGVLDQFVTDNNVLNLS